MLHWQKGQKKRASAAVLAGLTLLAGPVSALDAEREFDSTLEAIRALEQGQENRIAQIEALEEQASTMARRTAELRSVLREREAAIDDVEQQILEVQYRASRLLDALTEVQERGRGLLRLRWIQDRHPPHSLRGSDRAPSGGESEWAGLDRHLGFLDRRLVQAQDRLLGEMQLARNALSVAETALEDLRGARIERRRLAQESLRSLQREEAALTGTMDALRDQIGSGRLELERLQHNARILEEMLATLPPAEPAPESFGERRGLLTPPIAAPRIHRFGETRGTSGGPSTWRGDVFAITGDLDVRSVHAGTVVFADWMRGYGFLAIVDHGDGYLSLYGHNHELRVRPGDRIRSGEIIARVTPDTPSPGPGLYFELRREASVLNPGPWWNSKEI